MTVEQALFEPISIDADLELSGQVRAPDDRWHEIALQKAVTIEQWSLLIPSLTLSVNADEAPRFDDLIGLPFPFKLSQPVSESEFVLGFPSSVSFNITEDPDLAQIRLTGNPLFLSIRSNVEVSNGAMLALLVGCPQELTTSLTPFKGISESIERAQNSSWQVDATLVDGNTEQECVLLTWTGSVPQAFHKSIRYVADRLVALPSFATSKVISCPRLVYVSGTQMTTLLSNRMATIGDPPQRPVIPLMEESFGEFMRAALQWQAESSHVEADTLRLRVTTNRYWRSLAPQSTLEDSFHHVIVSLNTLCNLFRSSQKSPTSVQHVRDDIYRKMHRLITELRIETAELRAEEAGAETAYVHSICRRLTGDDILNVTKPLGAEILDLMSGLGLHDTKVLRDTFGVIDNDPHRLRWATIATKVRAQIAHDGSIGIDASKLPIRPVDMEKHLRDVAVRVLLKLLGYNGLYISTLQEQVQQWSLDWVQQHTRVEELGYNPDLSWWTQRLPLGS